MATTTETLRTPGKSPTNPGPGDLVVIRTFTGHYEAETRTRIYYGRVVANDGETFWYQEINPFRSIRCQSKTVRGIPLANMARDKAPAEMPTGTPLDWSFQR
jgi:hypothetical protein